MIYLDYNATTPLCDAAWRAMQPYFERHFGNPSSVHRAGRETRAAVDDARDRLAALLGVKPHEIIFTSGGTEANNLALLGLARRLRAKRKAFDQQPRRASCGLAHARAFGKAGRF